MARAVSSPIQSFASCLPQRVRKWHMKDCGRNVIMCRVVDTEPAACEAAGEAARKAKLISD
jgi:hypothetical protein